MYQKPGFGGLGSRVLGDYIELARALGSSVSCLEPLNVWTRIQAVLAIGVQGIWASSPPTGL